MSPAMRAATAWRATRPAPCDSSAGAARGREMALPGATGKGAGRGRPPTAIPSRQTTSGTTNATVPPSR
jgi:hypothetical protein